MEATQPMAPLVTTKSTAIALPTIVVAFASAQRVVAAVLTSTPAVSPPETTACTRSVQTLGPLEPQATASEPIEPEARSSPVLPVIPAIGPSMNTELEATDESTEEIEKLPLVINRSDSRQTLADITQEIRAESPDLAPAGPTAAPELPLPDVRHPSVHSASTNVAFEHLLVTTASAPTTKAIASITSAAQTPRGLEPEARASRELEPEAPLTANVTENATFVPTTPRATEHGFAQERESEASRSTEFSRTEPRESRKENKKKKIEERSSRSTEGALRKFFERSQVEMLRTNANLEVLLWLYRMGTHFIRGSSIGQLGSGRSRGQVQARETVY